MSQLDLAIVVVYMVAALAVGIYFGRKTDSFKDFAIGDRKLGTFALFATMFATYIGGGSTVGLSEKSFRIGLVAIFIFFGRAIRRLIESFFVFKRMDRCLKNSSSPGDIMKYFYGRSGKFITGVVTTLLMTGVLGIQMRAIGYFFELFLEVTFTQGVFLGCGVIIIYSSFGGMRAVVATDGLQFAVLFVALPLLAYYGLKQVGGYTPIFEAVPEGHLHFFPHGENASQYFSIFLLYSFRSWFQ